MTERSDSSDPPPPEHSVHGISPQLDDRTVLGRREHELTIALTPTSQGAPGEPPHSYTPADGSGVALEGMLLVANYPSDVGFAWWLMESFWALLGAAYGARYRTIVAFPRLRAIPEVIVRSNLEPIQFHFRPAPLPSIGRQLRFLRRNRIRVVYLTDRAPVDWRYALYRVAGVRRIIVHDHTPGSRSVPTGVKRWIKRVIPRIPWIAADALIGASEFVSRRNRESALFPAGRIYTVCNGVSDHASERDKDARLEFGIAADCHIVVSISRAHHIKGIDRALAVIRELVVERKRDDVHILHLGDGPELPALREAAARMHIEEHVTFPGSRADARSLLASCDVALMLSRGEIGYSLSILEAMAAGLPVVVSDEESVREATIDGETGFRVDPDAPGEVADVIERLVDDAALRKRIGENGRAVQRERYRLRDTHQELLEAMGRILGE